MTPTARHVNVLDSPRYLDPVVQKADDVIHWINQYPLDSAIGLAMTYCTGQWFIPWIAQSIV